MLKKLHHVAYRCKDAKQTVEFYTKMLDLKYNASVTNDRVPSTQEFYPHLHVFFEMEDGSYIAFFETPTAPEMSPRDGNTPEWVQHLALEVADVKTMLAGKERLEKAGHKVLGPIDHGFCQSIYFFDPSGHRLELTAPCWREGEKEEHAKEAGPALAAWEKKKREQGWVKN